jgi:hypothetical protein
MAEPIRLPGFFIIGAAKCGTTELASVLDKHPKIRVSEVKEPTFFSRDDLFYHNDWFLDEHIWKTLDWQSNLERILREYGRHFEGFPPDVLCGEASPTYILSRRAAGRIRELIPDARLIVMLREPTSRMVSHYWYHVQNSRMCMAPDSLFYSKLATPLLQWGMYAEHLRHWLSVFPREQFHVVLFEEYIAPATRQGVMDGICHFLGVEPALDAVRTKSFSNKTGIPRWVSLELALNMIRLRYHLPGSTAFEDRSPRGPKRRLINAFVQAISRMNISYDRRPPAWSQEIMERLRAYFRYENAELSGLIGRDVDAIWYGRDKSAPAAAPFTERDVEPAIPDRSLAVR